MLFNRNFADLITFARASSGWSYSAGGVLMQSNAGVPRLDFDPLTLAARGMFAESSATNILTQSEFANGVTDAAIKGGPLTAVAVGWLGKFTTALGFGWDGTTTSYAYKAPTMNATTQYVFSAFIQMDDGLAPAFASATPNAAGNDFTFIVAGVGVAPNTYTTANLGGGVYRVAGQITTGASPTGGVGIAKYTSNSNRTFKATGFQFELGAAASSYIPTTTAQVTRAAENAVIADLSKIGWNQAAGTAFAEFILPRLPAGTAGDVGAGIICFDEPAFNNYYGLAVDTLGVRFLSKGSGGNNSRYPAGAVSLGTPMRVAFSFGGGLQDRACLNGGAVLSNGISAPAGLTEMRLGRFSSNPGYLNGWLRSVRYFPRQFSDTELQNLTAL